MLHPLPPIKTMEEKTLTTQERVSATAINDIRSVLISVVDDAPPDSVGRLSARLMNAGTKAMQANYSKSVLAEEIYLMKVEEDWKYFLNPDSNKTYQHWDEFHETLIRILPISESASWFYQKVVRYGYEILELDEGQFAEVGGLTTIGKMLELSVVNGYDRNNWADSVRPATVHFKELLDGVQGDTNQEKLKAFFFSTGVAHDYDDPSAVNLPARELNPMVDEFLGRPNVWFEIANDDIVWHIEYPSKELISGTFVSRNSVPAPVMMEIMKGLRTK